VPLERSGEHLQEFLLVPYYGACIHTPAPPANQIIRITSPLGSAGLRTMNPVWVQGRLQIADAGAPGGARYWIDHAVVDRY